MPDSDSRKQDVQGNIVTGDQYVTGDIRDSNVVFGRGAQLNVYHGSGFFQRLNYRADIADILDFHTRIFVGREDVAKEIATFAAGEQPGYLLVEALAGFGKSALVANLIHRHENNQWPHEIKPTLLYFFIREVRGQNTATAFLEALNSQLLDVLGQSGGIPTGYSALHSQFSALWAEANAAATASNPLLLLVDGFDEMAERDTLSGSTIAAELPSTLGLHVHILLTSRPNPEPLRRVSLEHAFRKTQFMRLNVLTESDVANLFHANGLSRVESANLAPHAFAITRGEPLLVRFVTQEIAEADDKLSKVDALEQHPPKDVADYFEGQLEQLRQRADGALTRQILGLLAVAKGGMAPDEIAEVLDQSLWDVQQALHLIQRFLIGSDHFELMHLELRRAVRNLYHRREAREFEERLVTWGATYHAQCWPFNTPGYILLHYAYHLYDLNYRADLYDLLNRDFVSAKINRTGSIRSFAQDLELMLCIPPQPEACPRWPDYMRAAAAHGSLSTAASNLPKRVFSAMTLLRQGDRALSYAALVSDPWKRCHAYTAILEVLGEVEPSRTLVVLNHAVNAANAVSSNFTGAAALRMVAASLIQRGDKERALWILEQAQSRGTIISDEWAKVSALQPIAMVLAQAGQHERALDVLEQVLLATRAIPDELYKAPALRKMAAALARVGKQERSIVKLKEALSEAVALSDQDRRAPTLQAIAAALAQAGAIDQAVEVALTISHHRYQASALTEIAAALAETGTRERTLTTVERALSAASSIAGNIDKAEVLTEAAAVFAKMGNEERALAILEQALALSSDRWMAWREADTLQAIAAVMAQAGERERAVDLLKRALTIVKSCADDGYQWYFEEALTAIGLALAGVAEQEGTQHELEHLLSAVNAITDKSNKAKALTSISPILVKAGAVEEMLSAVTTIQDDWQRADALAATAVALAQAGDTGRAATVIEEICSLPSVIVDQSSRANALGDITVALAEVGAVDEALSVAAHNSDEWFTTVGLIKIAVALAQVHDREGARSALEQALLAAKPISSEWPKAAALQRRAVALAQMNSVEQALTTASAMLAEWRDGEALAAIILALARAGETVKARFVFEQLLSATTSLAEERPLVAAMAEIGMLSAEVPGLENVLIQSVEAISDQLRDADALREVAKIIVQAAAADEALSAEALSVIISISDETAQANALIPSARALADAGFVDQAQLAANAIRDVRAKAVALRQIAAAVAGASSGTRALNLLEQAVSVAAAISNEPDKAAAMTMCAADLARFDNQVALAVLDQSLTVASVITDNRDKMKALTPIAVALAQIGEVGRALSVANAIAGELPKVKALCRIAAVVVKPEGRQDIDGKLLAILEVAHHQNLNSLWSVTATAAPYFARIDNGKTLYQIYEAMTEVESWWR